MKKQLKSSQDEQYVCKQSDRQKRSCVRWTKQENLKYITFLKATRQDFESQYTRKIKKVFMKLSEHMVTKNKIQCKSHHQKMMLCCKTIDQIISTIQSQTSLQQQVKKEQNTQQDLKEVKLQYEDEEDKFGSNEEKIKIEDKYDHQEMHHLFFPPLYMFDQYPFPPWYLQNINIVKNQQQNLIPKNC